MMQTDAKEPTDEPINAEVIEAKAPEPAPEILPARPKPKSNAFGGAVFGGIVAAIAGFALAQVVPNGWPSAATKTLSTQVAAQAVQINALSDQMAIAPKTTATDPVVLDRLTVLEGKQGFDPMPLEDRISALESRLLAIEKLPADGSGATAAAVAALQANMQALRQAVAAQNTQGAAAETEAQLKEVQTIAAETTKNADELAKSVRRLAALGQLRTAFDTGAGYAPSLAELTTQTGSVPAVLTDNADSGLPTMSGVKAAFPPAARLALDAALRANMGESWSERAASFLRSQTGARSLEPREGSDPDAVLSRAEAAVNTGDLTTALTELQALPPEAVAALAPWQEMAETRLAAEHAIAALAATFGE